MNLRRAFFTLATLLVISEVIEAQGPPPPPPVQNGDRVEMRFEHFAPGMDIFTAKRSGQWLPEAGAKDKLGKLVEAERKAASEWMQATGGSKFSEFLGIDQAEPRAYNDNLTWMQVPEFETEKYLSTTKGSIPAKLLLANTEGNADKLKFYVSLQLNKGTGRVSEFRYFDEDKLVTLFYGRLAFGEPEPPLGEPLRIRIDRFKGKQKVLSVVMERQALSAAIDSVDVLYPIDISMTYRPDGHIDTVLFQGYSLLPEFRPGGFDILETRYGSILPVAPSLHYPDDFRTADVLADAATYYSRSILPVVEAVTRGIRAFHQP